MVTGYEPVTHFALQRRWGASYRLRLFRVQSGELIKGPQVTPGVLSLYVGWNQTHSIFSQRWGSLNTLAQEPSRASNIAVSNTI